MPDSLTLTANDMERLQMMVHFGEAILITPEFKADGDFAGNGAHCAICMQESENDTPFFVCPCLSFNHLMSAVREHVKFHVDKILTVREN